MDAERDKVTSDDARSEHALKVFYDGGCPLCRREIAHYRKIDRAGLVDFVDLTREGADTGPDLSKDAALARFHVRDGEGRLMSGAAAFVRLWRELPGWRWLAPIAKIPGVTWIMECAYRGFLPLRPRLRRLIEGDR